MGEQVLTTCPPIRRTSRRQGRRPSSPAAAAAAVAAVPKIIAPAIMPAPITLRENITSSLIDWTTGLFQGCSARADDLRGARAAWTVWTGRVDERRRPSRRRNTSRRHSSWGKRPSGQSGRRRVPCPVRTRWRRPHWCIPPTPAAHRRRLWELMPKPAPRSDTAERNSRLPLSASERIRYDRRIRSRPHLTTGFAILTYELLTCASIRLG